MLYNDDLLIVLRRRIIFDRDQKAAAIDQNTGRHLLLAICGLQYNVLLERWSTPLNPKAVFQICFDAPVHRMSTAFQINILLIQSPNDYLEDMNCPNQFNLCFITVRNNTNAEAPGDHIPHFVTALFRPFCRRSGTDGC
jgi:hypothetical protein